jgi:hypothetical protein
MLWLAPILGVGIITFAMADIFLTVLYARSGIAFLGERLVPFTWRVARLFGGLVPPARERILSFAGPIGILITLGTWIVMLLLGFALVIWPRLGTSFHNSTGAPTPPTGFITAMYVSGGYLTTCGAADLTPATSSFRLLAIVESIFGMSVITGVLTFLVEVYDALRSRNAFALKLHHSTGSTGDAALLIAGLGPGGDFEGARSELAEIGAELERMYESHHFHSALLYFRFHQPHYALSRIMAVSMDTVTLIKTALDDERYAHLKQSRPVTQMWWAGTHLLSHLARVFLPKPHQSPGSPPDAQTEQRWRRRYRAALGQLRSAGIPLVRDEQAGADAYVALRQQWDAYVVAFAMYMAHSATDAEPGDLQTR